MGIVTGLFRQLAPELIDSLEAQGVVKGGAGMFDFRPTPSTVPEMFIGGEGISNLAKSGMIDETAAKQALVDAQKDWFKLDAQDWMKKWADSGIAYDPVARKAMMEISDENVTIKKGIDLNTMPANEVLGFDEVFNAETLKKAYPDIGNIKIGFLDETNSPRLAAFDDGQLQIGDHGVGDLGCGGAKRLFESMPVCSYEREGKCLVQLHASEVVP